MFNRVILVGNLTKDVELRYAPSGAPVATLPIAVNSRSKSAGGEQKDEVLFIDCVVWGKQAEACGQYLARGRPVLVEGRLRERRWEQEGQRRSRVEVIANTVRFLGSGKPAGEADAGHELPPPEITDTEPF
ncbi:MAG TPA: single-stranded DNA-binding protein [Dissulfurispiraceae bacterium]|nr:single-stranded DNA-binding protein [Dissulfurispiraceae bacterium]